MTCPKCSSTIDLDEEELDEGDPVSCDECGSELRVVSTHPVELELADEDEEEEEEDEEEEDFDEDEDEEGEFEEEEEEDEWS
jgi:alpha-aminoadipate carrier protein LysW